jgi:hypothetical protein
VGGWALAAMVMQMAAAPAVSRMVRGESWSLTLETFDISLLLFAALLGMAGTAFERAAGAIKADHDLII